MAKAKTKPAICYFEGCIYRLKTGARHDYCPFKGCMCPKEKKQAQKAALDGKDKKEEAESFSKWRLKQRNKGEYGNAEQSVKA